MSIRFSDLSPAMQARVGLQGKTAVKAKRIGPLTLEVPLKVVSVANRPGEHWGTKHQRSKRESRVVGMELLARRPWPEFPVRVTFTRLAPQVMDDDNLRSAFKATRDTVARLYGVDDGDAGWEWQYKQEHCRDYAIRIEIQGIRRRGGLT